MNDNLDPTVVALARAIKKQETGSSQDPYNARGSSGEFGAYQFMPDTWKARSAKYLGNANADPSVENQNRVQYMWIKDLKDQGYSPAQIAAAHNAGEGSLKNDAWKTNVGRNSFGVQYDTPAYVTNVSKYYQEFKPRTDLGPNEVAVPGTDQTFNYGEVPEAQVGPVDKAERLKELGANFVEPLTNPFTAIGGGVQNAIRAGGRELGFDTPAQTTVPSLITGSPVDPIGHRNGQELGPVDTLKQGTGRAIEAAALLYAPETLVAAPIRTMAVLGGTSAFGNAVANDKSWLDTLIQTGVGTAGGTILGTGGVTLSKLFPATDSAITKDIITEFTKAVKPTVAGKNTSGAVEKYNENALDALHSIAANKDNLRFNTNGIEETGRTPESLSELGDAISQTKGTVYSKYNALTKQATGQGAKVETQPVVSELNKLADDQALNLSSPQTAQYASDMAERFGKVGSIDADVVEKVIQNYNNNLKSFYANPTYDTASRVGVDAMIANMLRSELDKAIEGATGAQYQVLKNLYGSLKSIEKDVVKRAIVTDRKQPAGLIDYADIFSAGDLINGIVTLNPAMFAKAAAQKTFKEYLKYLNSPDRAVKSIFKNINKLQERGFVPKGTVNEVTPKIRNETPNETPLTINLPGGQQREPYLPDNRLPTIDMGPKAISKYQREDPNLPTLRGSVDIGLLNKLGIGSAGALGAAAAFNKLKEMGHDTYVRQEQPAAPQVVSTTNDKYGQIIKLDNGVDVRPVDRFSSAIQKAYQEFPNLPKGFLESVLMKESSMGTQGQDHNNPGKYGYLVAITKPTVQSIKIAAVSDPRYKELASKMKFDTPEQAIRAAAAYADFRSKIFDKSGAVVEQVTDPVKLYIERYHAAPSTGGMTKKADDFKKMFDFYSRS